ncbi:hypothetical protein B1757_02300 [Acidithiobacillus marinus]|uniref:HTH cro/C1-type domain-containing protein n=1 Tax=Acidithiobacillus marinus TaxID=187490 RepID=A0A2I1DPH5_9PROT|nr:helix-turn-helix domain-containing protein [Acidithiobacillus marinus]PKY11814.1 hypothetical protein B1757_02300 [Acidithiobacillus marinus]
MESTLSERIRLAREAAGLSMSELARRLNVSKQVVWSWENRDIKDPRLEHILALRDILNISIDWLVTGKGEMREKNDPARVLSERQKSLVNLFDALPESEQNEFFRRLQEKKSYFDTIMEELLAKKKY